MALAFDGTPVGGRKTFGGGSTYALPNFSTSLSGSLVILAVRNVNEGIVSVVGSTLGSFVRIGSEPPGPSTAFTTKIELYAKIASGPLTNEVVTVNIANNYDPIFAMWAVSGHNQTSEAAAFGSIVGNSAGAFNAVLPRDYTTTAAPSIVFGISGIDYGGTPDTLSSGWTSLIAVDGNNLHVQRKALSATATETVSVGSANDLTSEVLIVAVYEAAGGGGGPVTGTMAVTEGADGATFAGEVEQDWDFLGVSNVVEVTGTSHALSLAGLPTLHEGDLLIACIGSRISSASQVTLPSGWTRIAESLTSNALTTTSAVASGTMAFIVRGSSDPALTFTHPAAPSVALGRIVAYRPKGEVAKDTQVATATAVNTTSVSTTGLTTAAANELLVRMAVGGQEAAWSAFNAATSPNTSSGSNSAQTADPITGTWQERADSNTTTGNDMSLAIADAVKSASGATGNLTATASLGASHVQITVAFRIISRTGTMAATEGADSASMSGTVSAGSGPGTRTGTLAATEGADVASFVGKLRVAGTMAAAEGADVASAAGTASQPTKWNGSDSDSGFTLADVGRGGVCVGTAGVRSTKSKSSGKQSVLITGDARGAAIGLGVSLAGAHRAGGDSNSFLLLFHVAYGGWFVLSNNTIVGSVDTTSPAATGDDTLVAHIDSTANRVYFTANGNNLFGGNPAAGTGGITIPSGPHFAMAAATDSKFTSDFCPTDELPTGYSGWDASVATTLNPFDADALGTLSNGNKTLSSTHPAPDAVGARSTKGYSRGKHSFSFECDMLNTNVPGSGVTDNEPGGGVTLNDVGRWGQDTSGFILLWGPAYGGWCVYTNHTIPFTDGTSPAPIGTDVAKVHIDSDANRVYFEVNGHMLFGGNPAAGTGGITIPAGMHYATAAVTLNTVTVSFIPTGLPSGYSSWDAQPLGRTGTLAAVEGADVASASGNVRDNRTGTLAATDGADVASASGRLNIRGTMAATEGADGTAFAGKVNIRGTMAATDGADIAAASGSVSNNRTGTLAATEGADGSAAVGKVRVAGTLAATEGADIAAIAGTITNTRTGTLAATDGADIAAAVGKVHVRGTMAATDGADGMASGGLVRVTGALAATEGADRAAFIGTLTNSRTGTLAATEGADAAAAAGKVLVRGTLAATEGADVAAITGTISANRTGTLAATEGADVAAMAGRLPVRGTMAATDGADVATASGGIANNRTGTLAATEGADRVAAIGRVIGTGTILVTEGADGASFNGRVRISGMFAATEGADLIAMSGKVLNSVGPRDVEQAALLI